MASFVKFECFSTDVAAGTHANALNADTDTLSVYLTNATPNVATHSQKSHLAEIATGNGYTGPQDTLNAATKTAGVISVAGTDIVINATGSVGPFRYAVLFNDTAASDNLIGYWDYGSSAPLTNGESFTVDFGTEMFTVG